MALTRITKGVIKPNENYDTHNINSTGIVTAIGLDINGNGDISGNLSVGGVLTYEDVTSIDSVGIITAQKGIHVGAGVSAVGVGTFGSLDISGDIDVDGHTNLDNVSITGVTTLSHTGANQLVIKDSDTSGSSSHMRISFQDSGGTEKFFVGNNNNNDYLYLGSGAGQPNPTVIRYANSDKLTVENSRVYINTSLEVVGSITAADSIIHQGDTNTKIRFPAADTITAETAGSERLRIDSSGRLLLNTTTTYSSNQMMIVKGASPSGGGNRPYDGQLAIESTETSGAINTGGVLAFIGHDGGTSRGFGSIRNLKEDGTSGNYGTYMSFETRTNGSAPAEKLRITSDGKLLVGGGASRSLGWEHLLQVEHTNSTPHGISLIGNRANQYGPNLTFAKTRSASLGGNTIVQDNDTLAQLVFRGSDGVDLANISAMVGVVVDGTPAENNVPGSFEIYTGGFNKRLTIDASGRVLIGTTTVGHSTADDLTIASSGSGGISIRAEAGYASNIHFADGTTGDDQYRGIIQYHHNGDSMRFFTNATEKVRIDSSGRVLIGTVKSTNSATHYDDLTINNSDQSAAQGSTGIDLISSNESYGGLIFSDEDAYEQGYIKYWHDSNADKMRFGTNNNDRWEISKDGYWIPVTDSLYDIGTNANRVRNLYTDNFYGTSLSYDGNTLKFGDGSGPSTTTYYNDIIIDNSNNTSGASGGAGITLYSGTSSWGGLIFGDGDAHQQGYIKYSHQSDYMNFGVGGSEVMKIENGGSVGITSAIHHIGDSHTEFGFPSTDSFLLKVAGESRIYTHPSEAIWNRRDANAGITTQTMLINYNTAAGTGCAIGFAPSGVNYNARHSSIEVVNEGNNQMTMRFKVTDPSVNDHAVERMRINKDGKFCLGTFNANYASNDGVVSIVNAASSGTENPLLTLWNPTTVADARAGIDFLTNAQYGTSRDGAFIRGSNDGVTAKAHIQFGTIKDETYTETLRLTSGGHLVTGGSTPPNQAANDGSLFLKNDATLGFLSEGGSLTFNAYYNGGWKYYTTGDAHILWGSGDGINLSMAGSGTANNAVSFSRAFQVTTTKTFHFGSQTSLAKYNDGTEGCSWYDQKQSWQQGQDGNIGWSMMYFNKKSGSDNRIMHFFNNGTTCGYINRVSGNNTTQYATSSDYRLKKDIVALPNGIERVKQLRPVAFKWKSNNGDMEGFLAHEAQEIVPYAVSGKKDEVATEDLGERKKGDMIIQGVDYGEFTPLLTAALKELITKVETLEAKVAALEGS